VRTFTIGFHEPEFDEARHAAAVARHLGTDHTELYVTPEQTLGVLPKLPELYDEPFADSSQIPTYLVSELARRSVTVSLSGDGGDEVFGGYERHIRPSLWYGLPGLPGLARRGGAAALRAIPERGWDAVFRAIAPVIPTRARRHAGGDRIHRAAEIVAGAGSPADVYDQLSRQWDRAERIVIGTSGTIASPAAWPAVDHVAHGLMFADLMSYLPDDILVKVDRATMGVSLESRAPLLDHHVVEFAWRLPRSMKIGDGRGKLPLRRLLERFVPRSLFERPKMGFAVPVDVWLRGPLREWAETLLSESRLRDEGIFDPAPIRRRWTEHLAGRRNWKDSLWTVLMFQAWHESRPGARQTQSSSGGSATLAPAADQRP
jgi:asparagine synthase (glutamine-hydrolysing)